ncbi:toxin-activating lysine-acyltransferase [Pedomonas mirosovicensis]|uniref:toxin-activating lysine-acyltransferase n=1 Tax=Pedomonas mirosovicensis TaxID=2908641 RepID=UPI0021693A79|nr:toxin-activating lysine-acyltransferase [Pedomonas mirosovicensis]MCH8686611.1 toxin-activating lysine-acyltransferase [Pedomonas mirosovicensis]
MTTSALNGNSTDGAAVAAPSRDAITVSHALGEMVWLLTRSPLHRGFSLADLEWLVMPALMHQQFYIFRDRGQPVGLALWAKCTPQAERKLEKGITEPENRLTPLEWVSGDQVWLIDLVAPFATAENRHREIMMADLIAGPLRGQAFKLHRTDPQTGERRVVLVEADAGEKLKAAIKKAVDETEGGDQLG